MQKVKTLRRPRPILGRRKRSSSRKRRAPQSSMRRRPSKPPFLYWILRFACISAPRFIRSCGLAKPRLPSPRAARSAAMSLSNTYDEWPPIGNHPRLSSISRRYSSKPKVLSGRRKISTHNDTSSLLIERMTLFTCAMPTSFPTLSCRGGGKTCSARNMLARSALVQKPSILRPKLPVYRP